MNYFDLLHIMPLYQDIHLIERRGKKKKKKKEKKRTYARVIEPLWTEVRRSLTKSTWRRDTSRTFLLTKDGGTEKRAGWPCSTAAGRTGELSVPDVDWHATTSPVTGLPQVRSWKLPLFPVGEVGVVTYWVVSLVSGAEKKENIQAGNWVS